MNLTDIMIAVALAKKNGGGGGGDFNPTGSYDGLTAGKAKQLKATVATTDQEPYAIRTAGGSIDIGEEEKQRKLVGGTVCWNQLAALDASKWNNGNVTMSISGRVISLTNSTNGSPKNAKLALTAGHVYYACGTAGSPDGGTTYGRIGFFDSSASALKVVATASGVSSRWGCGIYTAQSGELFCLRNTPNASSIGTTCTYADVMLIDLTKLFGAAIAGYLQTIETAHAGDGCAWFRKLFPKPYYAASAATLQSVKAAAHVTVGFNACDSATGKAQVVGGMEYQISGTYTGLTLDGATVTPNASTGKFTPEHSGVLTVGGGDATTCVHLVWDGERDGQFEAYAKHSYALDDELELRGLWKLDAGNKLYFDGDTYAPDGTVVRKYASRAYASGDEALSDAITDGTTTVYKLTTATTESADAYTAEQLVDDFGTEEYVDAGVTAATPTRDVSIPVGHVTDYPPNLRAKLEMAPVLPANDGKFVLQMASGLAEYVTLPTELPALPSSDGSYTLKVTVSDGTATLTWAADG